MDHHVPSAIVVGLRARGVDVLTAREDDRHEADDSVILDRATMPGRVVFTRDRDFLRECARRQRQSISFYGAIYVAQLEASIGRRIEDIQLLVEAEDLENILGQVHYLPI